MAVIVAVLIVTGFLKYIQLTMEEERIYIGTNVFVRWYNNRPLFVGTMAGVVMLFSLLGLLSIYKFKKASE